jgi:hypothetical protein
MNKKLLIVISVILIIGAITVSQRKPQNIPPTETQPVINATAQETVQQAITQQLSQKYSKPMEAVLVNVENSTDLFAKGTIGFSDEMGGGIWLAAKTQNGWELAFDGNGIVSCEILNKYNFPKDIAPGCVDMQTDQFVQR